MGRWAFRFGRFPQGAFALLLSALAVSSVLIAPACSRPPAPTASATSPDGRFRVELREVTAFVDRNFEVVLVDQRGTPPTSRVIFTSPDEGNPPGTERFVWSVDSRALLLVGEHFFTIDEAAERTEGEQPYLLYDVADDSLWCNASQLSDLEQIDSALLARYGLADWQGHN